MIIPYIYDGGVLTAAATTQGTVVGVSTRRIIKTAHLINTTAATVQATIYMVPSGGAAGAGNTLISARPIYPGETYECGISGQGLNAGGFIQALGLGLTFKYAALDIVQ